MDIRRRRLKANSIKLEINECEKFIERSNETIGRLKHTSLDIKYIKNHIYKLKTSISQKEERLLVLNNEMLAVNKGGLDTEINLEYKKNENRQKKLNEDRKNIMKEKQKEKKENKDISKKYWDGIIGAVRSEKQKEKDMKYSQTYFQRVCDSLPEYMKRNLADMPNNKGYIWRGVYFYGRLDEDSGPRVLFEKRKGGLLIIHEYTEKEYKIFEKNGKDRKKIVEKYDRKKKQSGINIMDYLKK